MDLRVIIWIFTGWLLGILSHLLVAGILWLIRNRRFKRTLFVELAELQYKLTRLSFDLISKYGDLDTEYIKWYAKMIRSYEGPNARPEEIHEMEKIEELSDKALKDWERAVKSKAQAVTLKKYKVPYLTSQMHMVSGVPLGMQKEIIEILAQLEILHEETDLADYHFKSALISSGSPDDCANIIENLKGLYGNIGGRAQHLADRIDMAKR